MNNTGSIPAHTNELFLGVIEIDLT